MTSWLVRLAQANRTKLHSLCRLIAGNQATVWNRDADRMAPEWMLRRLAMMSGLDAEEIRAHTLAAVVKPVNPAHHPNGYAAWILPLGIWHRKRMRAGVQFCPLCFRFDEQPYIRCSWRLAYYTECEWHHVMLQDKCPECLTPHAYFRGELGQRRKHVASGMNHCTACGFDLAYAPAHPAPEWHDWRITLAVRNLQQFGSIGWSIVGEHCHRPAWTLMLVVRQLITILTSNAARGALFDSVAQQLWPEGYRVLSCRGSAYEELPVFERHRILGMAVWLLHQWPKRLLTSMCHANVRRLELTRDMHNVPEWFEQFVKQLPSRRCSLDAPDALAMAGSGH